MPTRSTGWWVSLGLWSCAACAAWAQPADDVFPPHGALPAAEEVADGGPLLRSADGHLGSGIRDWWLYRAKPALQYSHWGYADEFDEVPLGARLRAAQEAQVYRGWIGRARLYRYDFCDGSAALNAAGHLRLRDLAGELPCWSHQVIMIEATPGRPQLDAARRDHVAKQLADLGTIGQVVIGVPRVAAPFGDETRVWHSRFMNQVRTGGSAAGGGAAGGGAAASNVGGSQPSNP